MAANLFSGSRIPRSFTTAVGLVLASGFLSIQTQANWPRYLGPTQNGVAPEKELPGGFPTTAPTAAWKANVGKGTSAVTVVGDRVFTMGNADGKDSVVCLDAKSGKELWRHQYPLKLDPNMFEGGPRSTPTIEGNRVYTVSHEGDLWCLDVETGKKVWYKHYQEDFKGRRPDWGFAGSATVAGNLLLIDVGAEGGSTMALDKATGATVWKSGNDKAGYASPVVGQLDGKQQVIVFKADAVVGYDLAKGAELWRSPWKTSYDVNAASPLLVGGDRVFVTSGYNTGCALIKVSGGKASELWRNKNLRAQINTPVPGDGVLYGIDGNTGGGNLVCLDLSTGNRKWEEKSVKGGSLIRLDGKLIILSEKGELVVADASPNGFNATLRAPEMDKRCWVQPTLSGGRLYLKNNEGDLACFDLGAK